jgi:NAD(P)-dependent dehydrogenase (short-subunit alcohol dehydrogenase family)
MGDLEGRVAIVTGGAKGIGLGCCEVLAEAGACVVIADIDQERAEAGANKIGSNAMAVKHDVRKADSARELVARTKEKHDRIDILVNNAGVGPNPAPIQDLTEEEYDRVLDINLKGVFLTARAVVPSLIEQGSGRVINVSSIVGQTGFAMVLHYVASKFAVIGVTQSLAHELAPHGITSNAVCPGIVETDLHSRVVEQFAGIQGTTVQEGWDYFRNRIPLHRFQTPRDLGEMVAFLASDRAKNITGATFNVDGGWEMH